MAKLIRVGRLLWLLPAVLTTSFLLEGCGGPDRPKLVRVTGIVTLNGQPLTSSRVRFVPDGPQQGRTATGDLDQSGNFKLSTFEPDDGILPGAYKVDVNKITSTDESDSPEDREKQLTVKSTIPAKYGNLETSGLTFTFSESDSNRKLELKLEGDN